MLLFFVFRDYQKFVHGMPGRTLSAEQTQSLRQALRDRDTMAAVKLVRQAFPDASLAEARAYVGKFAREEMYRQEFPGASQKAAREGSEKVYAEFLAELEAKYPLAFAPPKLGDLNWRLMGWCFLGEAGLFAGVWLMNPPASPAGRLLVFTAWFLSGALITLSVRLKRSWKRFLVIMLCFLPPSLLTWHFFEADASFLMGLVFGALTMVWGFTPKKRKSLPGKGSTTDVAPPN